MPIHHANVRCDDCGERHARDHRGECVEQLVVQVADLKKQLANEKEKDAALQACMDALQDANDMMRRHIPADESVIVPGICRKVDAALAIARKAVTS